MRLRILAMASAPATDQPRTAPSPSSPRRCAVARPPWRRGWRRRGGIWLSVVAQEGGHLRIVLLGDAELSGQLHQVGRGGRVAAWGHLAEGSTVVHDKERAHNGVTAERKCESEAYKADVTDPAYLDAMEMVNNLSSWLKRYLWRFTGMDPSNLQSYLNWFVYLFRVRQAEEKWPKTARVVRHLMMADATYRT